MPSTASVRRFRIAIAAGTLLAGSLTTAAAQSVPARTLSRPDARYAEPFTSLVGIRELSDGRVLIGDSHERTVQLLDLVKGTARVIGREGAGPEEYAIPSRLIALAGDTTLLYDAGNDRYLVILGDGRIAGTMLLETSSGSRMGGAPSGWDAIGGFYYRRDVYSPGERRMGDTPERAAIIRFDRRDGRIDTVAMLAIPAGRSQGARQLQGGMLQMIDNRPLAGEDVAAVAPDGRVAVVRATPYRVEWVHRDGRRVVGPEVRHQPRRVTDDDKRAFLRTQIRPGNIIVRRPAGGEGRAMPIERSGLPRPQHETNIDDPALSWPSHMPPFLAGAARVAPDGTLWVLRTRAHTDPVPSYDLFDAAGRLAARVALPQGTRLLGFGNGTVYLIRVDPDDLQWIERYRL